MKRPSMPNAGAINILLALLFALGILGSPQSVLAQSADLVAAANKEGTLIIYGPPGQQYRPVVVDAFRKEYPNITVRFSASSGRVTATKLLQEQRVGFYNADVYIGGTTSPVTALKPAKGLDDLENVLSPDLLNPRIWFQNKPQWSDGNRPYMNLIFQCSISHIVHVNPKLVNPKQFTSYKDLLDPKWKGKIVGTDIRRPGPGGVPSRFMYKNPELGPEYLIRIFRDTGITLSSDQRQLTDWIAQGQYPVGIFVSDSSVTVAQRHKLPIEPVPAGQFKEGAAIGPARGSVSLMTKAPHPNAARLYINWLLSQRGQLAWQKHVAKPSCRTDIDRTGIAEADILQPGVNYVVAATEEYSKLTGGTIRNLVTKALQKRKK